jgi:methionine-rich copper-binding protein CopC
MKKLGLALASILLVGQAAPTPATSLVPHFALSTSSPEADATVSAVKEIRLTFTQVPQESSARIRLVGPSGDPIETGELQSDPADGRTVFVSVESTLAEGAYTVAWRGIGDDGHVVRGEFGFAVEAER